MMSSAELAERHEGEVPLRARTFLQEDRARVGPQEILRPFADPIDYRDEVEEAPHLASQLGECRHLGATALGLVEQTEVLQRNA